MGTLKPGANYIYERDGDTVYAREFGADPSTRKIIGYDVKLEDNTYAKNFADRYFLEVEWADIIKEARTNPMLHDALERVKVLYHLSKKDA